MALMPALLMIFFHSGMGDDSIRRYVLFSEVFLALVSEDASAFSQVFFWGSLKVLGFVLHYFLLINQGACKELGCNGHKLLLARML